MRVMRRYEKTSEDLLRETRKRIIDAIVGPEQVAPNPWEQQEQKRPDETNIIRPFGSQTTQAATK